MSVLLQVTANIDGEKYLDRTWDIGPEPVYGGLVILLLLLLVLAGRTIFTFYKDKMNLMAEKRQVVEVRVDEIKALLGNQDEKINSVGVDLKALSVLVSQLINQVMASIINNQKHR